MLTETQKKQKVLQQVPFNPVSQVKLAINLKEVVTDNELYLILSSLVAEGSIQMNMGQKGPEFYRNWNMEVENERKMINRDLLTRFNDTIFYPRFDTYVANVEDNFFGNVYPFALEGFAAISDDYIKWHKNARNQNTIYPPKMQAINSSNVLACNIIAGMNLDPAQVEYGVEFEVIAKEQLRDRPDEFSQPKASFDGIISYADGVEFVQTSFLEPFFKPFAPSIWAYAYGSRYLFEDETAIEIWRNFAKKANFVYFDGYQTMRSLIAIYSEVLANPEEYTGKAIKLLSINWNLNDGAKYPCIKDFLANYFEEGKEAETKFNELLKTLPLPEGTTMEFEFLSVEDTLDALTDDAKEYITNRYLNF